MTRTTLATLALITLGGAAAAQDAAVDISIFPAARTGESQHVFQLTAVENEENYMIEIVAGRTMSVDCNTVMIGADFDDEDLSGWGYTYYKVDDISAPASTMMGCPDNTKSEKLVTFNMGHDALLRYNSRMPIVVYAPEDVTLGYRIWQTDGTLLGVTE